MIEILTEKRKLDINLIHQYLSNTSYWAKKIPKELVEKSIENSLCFGVYKADHQIGFARVISDKATFAYIADLFIIETEQGRGYGKQLMRAISEHQDLKEVRRWHLLTRDAQGLYEKFGFRFPDQPENHMEKSIQPSYLND